MGSDGWDEPPLDIQIPDDARELDRDVLAYHRELRAQRRRRALRRLAGPLARNGTIMPLLASILAICLVAGAMLSVATFSPAPGVRTTPRPTSSASTPRPTSSASTTRPSASTTRPPSPRPLHATAKPGVRPSVSKPGPRPSARASGSARASFSARTPAPSARVPASSTPR
jgi:hypothetical protein